MRGVVVPEREMDFAADPVELFFDLAYVLAFSQLVGRLTTDPDWGGVGLAALLFGLLWVPWQQLTWAANAVSGQHRAVRVLLLAATVTSVPMAASTATALDEGGPVFAISIGSIMLLGFLTQNLGADRGTDLHAAVVRWIAPNVLALSLLGAGATVAGTGRVWLWSASLLVVLAAMVLAGRGEWLIRTGHFSERHALIVIIALGEVVVAIGAPVVASLESGVGIPIETVVALVSAGAFAALLWWGYFDRPGPALEHRAAKVEGDRHRGRFVRDVYTWAHAPIVAGIILAAVALRAIASEPLEPVPTAFRAMLLGGLLFELLGISAAVWRAFRVIPHERVVAVSVSALVLIGGSGVDGVVLLVLVDLVMAVTLVVEHRRIEG